MHLMFYHILELERDTSIGGRGIALNRFIASLQCRQDEEQRAKTSPSTMAMLAFVIYGTHTRFSTRDRVMTRLMMIPIEGSRRATTLLNARLPMPSHGCACIQEVHEFIQVQSSESPLGLASLRRAP